MLQKQKYVVHTTLQDPNHTQPVDFLSNRPDQDEILQVHPRYKIQNVRDGVNLRVYLINHLYQQLLKKGVYKKNIIFISLHGDALHKSLQGAMVYYPDHRIRRKAFGIHRAIYQKRQEYVRRITFSKSANKQSEMLSKSFGKAVIDAFRHQGLPTHQTSAVRGYHIRNGKKSLPAVLRYSKILTSVLIEVANLNNAKDRKSVLQASIRQKMAKSVVQAIRNHYLELGTLMAKL